MTLDLSCTEGLQGVFVSLLGHRFEEKFGFWRTLRGSSPSRALSHFAKGASHFHGLTMPVEDGLNDFSPSWTKRLLSTSLAGDTWHSEEQTSPKWQSPENNLKGSLDGWRSPVPRGDITGGEFSYLSRQPSHVSPSRLVQSFVTHDGQSPRLQALYVRTGSVSMVQWVWTTLRRPCGQLLRQRQLSVSRRCGVHDADCFGNRSSCLYRCCGVAVSSFQLYKTSVVARQLRVREQW